MIKHFHFYPQTCPYTIVEKEKDQKRRGEEKIRQTDNEEERGENKTDRQ